MEDVLDIIVPTHNRLEMTIHCLNNIYKYTSGGFRVYVLDDSDDLTPLWIEKNKDNFPGLSYIRPENKFKSGNEIINLGLEVTQGSIVAHITNSVLVEPNWNDMAWLLINQDEKIGVVGFKLLLPYNSLIESAGIQMGDVVPLDIGRAEPSHHHTYIIERDAVAWSMVLLRKEAIKGNLEEDAFNGFRGWDDIDNCMVVKKKGWKILYCGAGTGYHYAHYTRQAKGMDDREKVYENMRTFIERNPGKITAQDIELRDQDGLLDNRGHPPIGLKLVS